MNLCRVSNITDGEEYFQLFNVILTGYITSTVCIIGFFGNVASVMLLRRKIQKRRSIATYAMVLATWDAVLLAVALAYYSLEQSLRSFGIDHVIFVYLTIILHPVAAVALFMVTWVLLIVTVERYRSIVKPFSFFVEDTPARAYKVSFLTFLGACIYSLPCAMEIKFSKCTLDNSTIIYQPQPTSMRLNETYNYVYRILCGLIFKSLGPFLVILFLSMKSILATQRNTKNWRQKLISSTLVSKFWTQSIKKRNRMDQVIAKTLLILSAKFLLTKFFPVALNVLELRMIGGRTFSIMVKISNFLVILNSATNCLAYIQLINTRDSAEKSQFNFMYNSTLQIEGSKGTTSRILRSGSLAIDQNSLTRTTPANIPRKAQLLVTRSGPTTNSQAEAEKKTADQK